MRQSKSRNMTRCAIGAALMALCAWITVPSPIPFTLQTLAAALIPGLLGGKLGFCSVAVYLGLGAAGLPVFSGFQGGLGILMGATGGYLLGFLVECLLFWLLENHLRQPVLMILGLFSCYIFGTAWYYFLYGSQSVLAIASVCVFPFVLPDLCKIFIALYLCRRLKPHLP